MDAYQLSGGPAKDSRPDTRGTQGEPCSVAAFGPRHSFQSLSKADRIHHTDCYGLRGGRIVFGVTFKNEQEGKGGYPALAPRPSKNISTKGPWKCFLNYRPSSSPYSK